MIDAISIWSQRFCHSFYDELIIIGGGGGGVGRTFNKTSMKNALKKYLVSAQEWLRGKLACFPTIWL